MRRYPLPRSIQLRMFARAACVSTATLAWIVVSNTNKAPVIFDATA
jgi:hypothetical protein